MDNKVLNSFLIELFSLIYCRENASEFKKLFEAKFDEEPDLEVIDQYKLKISDELDYDSYDDTSYSY